MCTEQKKRKCATNPQRTKQRKGFEVIQEERKMKWGNKQHTKKNKKQRFKQLKRNTNKTSESKKQEKNGVKQCMKTNKR